jgi:hypothetical protein
VAQRRLALEVPGLGDPEMARHLAKEYGLRPRHIRKLERLPLLGAAPSGVAQGAFFFTPAALRTVLLDHGREFARVDVVASPKSERFVAIAHKRRIGELVVVAGPSGAGKSVLMDLLAREPELARRLGVEDPASWQSVPAAQLRKLEEPEVPRLLLHYDLMRTARDGARTFERDSALDVIACAERVRVYTLVCEPRELSRRLSGRPPKSEGLRAQMQRDLAFHARPQALEDLYRGWEAFCRERELANTWIENGGGRPHFCEGSGFPGFGA